MNLIDLSAPSPDDQLDQRPVKRAKLLPVPGGDVVDLADEPNTAGNALSCLYNKVSLKVTLYSGRRRDSSCRLFVVVV